MPSEIYNGRQKVEDFRNDERVATNLTHYLLSRLKKHSILNHKVFVKGNPMLQKPKLVRRDSSDKSINSWQSKPVATLSSVDTKNFSFRQSNKTDTSRKKLSTKSNDLKLTESSNR